MKDKVAYITGGTKGIGFGIAQVLLQNGIKVAISGRKQEDAEAAANLLSKDQSMVLVIASDVKIFKDERRCPHSIEKLLPYLIEARAALVQLETFLKKHLNKD